MCDLCAYGFFFSLNRFARLINGVTPGQRPVNRANEISTPAAFECPFAAAAALEGPGLRISSSTYLYRTMLCMCSTEAETADFIPCLLPVIIIAMLLCVIARENGLPRDYTAFNRKRISQRVFDWFNNNYYYYYYL